MRYYVCWLQLLAPELVSMSLDRSFSKSLYLIYILAKGIDSIYISYYKRAFTFRVFWSMLVCTCSCCHINVQHTLKKLPLVLRHDLLHYIYFNKTRKLSKHKTVDLTCDMYEQRASTLKRNLFVEICFLSFCTYIFLILAQLCNFKC